ncbi:MAG TPA: hypothetical protein VN109_15900, partial [Devosia sp.]|nr:hypothetical protein [Devosia sp.]
ANTGTASAVDPKKAAASRNVVFMDFALSISTTLPHCSQGVQKSTLYSWAILHRNQRGRMNYQAIENAV